MKPDQTITVTAKPEIDREAVEEAAQMAAALFLSSFAVAVLEGIAAEEPPEEVLERVKAETLEKAAQEAGKWDGMIHVPQDGPYGPEGDETTILTPMMWDAATRRRIRPRNDVQPSEASQGTPSATDAPEAAQTLADLTPCLGDRVRVAIRGVRTHARFRWVRGIDFAWMCEDDCGVLDPAWWTVMEHLDPVTPDEPPVGSGMLVDDHDTLRRHGENGWEAHVAGYEWVPCKPFTDLVALGARFRPAAPADLARHGVGEDGEPVGKGEADDEHLTAACDWSDFRKDYGVSSDPELMQREHRAFLAGWQAGRHGDQSGVLR